MSSIYNPNELKNWDQNFVWHPFTPHSVYQEEAPLMIVAGDGHYLIDALGDRYLDGVGSIWCNLFGHRRSEIDAAIREQLERIAHATFLGNASAPGVVLAKRLIELAPQGLRRVFYSDNGSTAVEIAIKMALQYWQQMGDPQQRKRKQFLAFGEAYHGDTVGAVSVGGMELFHARFQPLLFEVTRCASPHSFHCKDEEQWLDRAIQNLEKVMDECGSELAAVVLEPGMQGASGMRHQPEGYLRAVRELCDRHGTLLILDEVAMGMGRSGHFFACQKEGVVPDLLCLAKGLTSGYLPLAATLATETIFAAFLGEPSEGRTFFHGHTYTGNALGAAAALATLDIFEHDSVIEKMPQRISYLTNRLMSLKECSVVFDIRQFGFCAGIELRQANGTAFNSVDRIGMKVCTAARKRGVFLRPLGDVIVLMPPLSIADEEIDSLIQAVHYGINAVLEDMQ